MVRTKKFKSERSECPLSNIFISSFGQLHASYEFQPPKSCKSHGTVLVKHLDFLSRHELDQLKFMMCRYPLRAKTRLPEAMPWESDAQRRAEPLPPLFVGVVIKQH